MNQEKLTNLEFDGIFNKVKSLIGTNSDEVQILTRCLISNYDVFSENQKNKIIDTIRLYEDSLGCELNAENWLKVKSILDPSCHCKVQSFLSVNNFQEFNYHVENMAKFEDTIKINGEFVICDAVRVGNKYYDLTMEIQYHSCMEIYLEEYKNQFEGDFYELDLEEYSENKVVVF